MRRVAGVVLLAGLLQVPVAAGDAPLPRAEDWKVVATDRFTVYSDADDKRTRQVLRDLEALRAVLAHETPGLRTRPARRVHAYVFEKAATFRRYLGDLSTSTKEIAGFHVTGPDRTVLAMTVGLPGNPVETFYREVLHEVLAATIPKAPLWLDRGIADYYRTFVCDGRVVEIGRPVRSHVMTLRAAKLMPVRELLALDGASAVNNDRERGGIVDAESWALVHWLMGGDAERRGRLAAYVSALADGTALDRASDAFGLSPDDIDRELAAYVAQARFPSVEVALDGLSLPEIPEPKPMEAHEALTSLGWLTLLTHEDDPTDSERHFRAALERAPRYAPAESGLAWILSTRGRADEAVALFDRALAADPTDPKTAFLAGMTALRREIERLGTAPGALAPPTPAMTRTREILARAVANDPDNALALAAYGASFVPTEGDPAPGVAALERAAELLPSEPSVAVNLALLYARAGAREKAQPWIERRVALVAEPADLARARDALLALDVQEAQSLFGSGKETEAIALLRSARARCSDPGFAASIDTMIESAEAAMRHNRIAARYNAAMEQIRAGKTEEARKQLAELAAECTEGEVCDQVRQTLEQIKGSAKR